MADLDFIRHLNLKYSKESETASFFRLKHLVEQFKIGLYGQTKGFDPVAINELGDNFITYFEQGVQASVCLLFIDVCNFSIRLKEYSGEQISEFFDDYYQKVIPIIYKHGGEIDKIIGDGLIAVFGQPFLNKKYPDCFVLADACAKDVILETAGTIYSSKVAFHAGKINYYKNKSGFYNEYTMVGKPLTELFRLESISQDECINYFNNSIVSAYYNQTHSGSSWYGIDDEYEYTDDLDRTWGFSKSRIENLNGVTGYSSIFHIRSIN